MSSPYSYEQFYRIHDAAMKVWVETFHVDYGTGAGNGPGAQPAIFNPPRNDVPIVAVMASPDRAFAAAADLLINTGLIPGSTQQVWQDTVALLNGLPLPIVSIYRGDAQFDPTMSGVPKRFPLGGSGSLASSTVQYWRPYRIPYQLDFWSQKTYTDSFFREWLESQCGIVGNLQNELYISVTHDPPYGVKRQSLLNFGARDNAALEGNQERYRRTTYSLSLRAWFIPNPNSP